MFKSARIKLTAWYLLVIMLVSLTFSAIIFRDLSSEVERFERTQRFRIERRLQEGQLYINGQPIYPPSAPFLSVNSELVDETKKRILFVLLVINGGILILSGGLGYFLAGHTLKPIKEMVDEQNRFISDASHELRTPLTSLKSAFEVYLREKTPTLEEAQGLVSESITEVNKLQILSDSLLSLAQFQKTHPKTAFKNMNLSETIQMAVKKIKPLADNKSIKMVEKLQKVNLLADKYSLTDLLVILLDNAVKYSRANSTITITAKKTDGWAKITVKDEGIGIPPSDMPHIFERFYRADSARSKSDQGGYGLGLSIAKQIVDMHKGAIQVSSHEGKGTTFCIRIPTANIPSE
ncbi:hypothetical protein A3D77_06075 [Candidatus Gottesmanbacteria bacterium RIFCSPHIGHO2_02_FULL_39_11]|uniref:histidine kinase n=1 Tax=Candidatus Gottesmanbacteria bacterium RIFCSPHIGHO2_02_FULL_39_11 TaxID=1798382 RepID=A0A1F5ZX73_9BACT|nr:MAG: hypothetical protein A3D77_06075 [Candidatus Gottesmanbacteria bacterium RIFCSPHIGHO2_02_FULL_39_11]